MVCHNKKNNMVKRLGVFFFFDEDGSADEYVFYLLNKMKHLLSELCVVANGKLDDKSIEQFQQIGSTLLLRDNKGLDAAAYQHAIRYYGYEKLASFDEVLFFNFTFFGPFWSLDKMFEDMSHKQCDWWSLYRCSMKPPYIEWSHLPSFFIVYRQSLLRSNTFKEYWESLPPIEIYDDSVMFHEERQTPFFDKRGFKNEVYFDFSEYDNRLDNDYWPLSKADILVIKNHFPFLKRRNLYVIDGRMNFNLVDNVIRYIKKNSDYPIRMIYDNISRTQDIDSLNSHIPSRLKIIKWKLLSKIHPIAEKRAKNTARLNNLVSSDQFKKLFS